MRDVWVAADSVVTPLGNTSEANFNHLLTGTSGVSAIDDPALSDKPVLAARMCHIALDSKESRFEKMCVAALENIKKQITLPADKTLFILSTTKGNIGLVEQQGKRIHLHEVAKYLADFIGLKHTLVISNACISGVMALTVAKRYIQSNKYDHALVLGADELNHFVISGFQSLNALSDDRCRPFDAERKGINLGEAAAALVVTACPEELGVTPSVKVLGTGLSNDANHISGPSRTGEELAIAIAKALSGSNITADEVDFVSAHGTATLYNDEMEAKAFTIAGLNETPLNSLKGFYGHTLGAAGVLETVMSIQGLLADKLIPSLGYQQSGVTMPLNIIRKAESKPLKTFLKTASGFGGCNAAIVMQKIN